MRASWAWALGDEANRLAPTLMGAQSAFWESRVLMVACGDFSSLVVTKDSALWTFCTGSHGALGHNYCNNRLVPTRIEVQHFDNVKIFFVAGGFSHSAAVTKEGTLYTWGKASGLGHANAEAKWVPTCIVPSLLQGARVGPCHDLPPMHALAFAMGTHSRLGSCAVPMAVAAGCSSQTRGRISSKARRRLLLTRARTVNMP